MTDKERIAGALERLRQAEFAPAAVEAELEAAINGIRAAAVAVAREAARRYRCGRGATARNVADQIERQGK